MAAPIEAQINGVDNMLYMTSTSSTTGQLTLTVYFTLNTDPDIAQVQVQNRVNLALPQLPDGGHAVRRLGAEEIVQSIMMLIAVFDKDGRYSAGLRRQLRQRLRARRDQARERRGPGADLRRAGPGDAHLDEPGPDGLARHHDDRHRRMRSASQNALFGAGQIGAAAERGRRCS